MINCYKWKESISFSLRFMHVPSRNLSLTTLLAKREGRNTCRNYATYILYFTCNFSGTLAFFFKKKIISLYTSLAGHILALKTYNYDFCCQFTINIKRLFLSKRITSLLVVFLSLSSLRVGILAQDKFLVLNTGTTFSVISVKLLTYFFSPCFCLV